MEDEAKLTLKTITEAVTRLKEGQWTGPFPPPVPALGSDGRKYYFPREWSRVTFRDGELEAWVPPMSGKEGHHTLLAYVKDAYATVSRSTISRPVLRRRTPGGIG